MIYYGTEVGLSGASDPDTRRTLLWEERPNRNQPDQIIELLTEEEYQFDSGQFELKLDAFSAKILKIK
jgi:hypothetical protein